MSPQRLPGDPRRGDRPTTRPAVTPAAIAPPRAAGEPTGAIQPRRKERDLTNAILALLRAHGIAAWRTGVGAYRASYQGRERFVRVGTKGMSDIVGVVPVYPHAQKVGAIGRFLAIEVKTPTGKIRPEQTAFLQTVTRAGGIGFVARSVDDVIDKLGLQGRREG